MNRLKLPHAGRRILAGGLLAAAAVAMAGFAGPAATAATLATTAHQAGKPPAANGTITWSVNPASATATDTRAKFAYFNIKPGSVIKDHFAILNRGAGSTSFAVYATDATGTTAANVLTFLQVGAKPRDLGAWVRFQPKAAKTLSLIVGGSKGIIVPFEIDVPSFATPGDHTAGIAAQVGVPHRNSAGQMVVLYQRIIVPLEIRMVGPLKSGLQVQSVSTSFNNSINPFGNGSTTVSFTVANTGNVRISGRQVVKVTGPFGMAAAKAPTALPVILPGDSVRITTTVGSLYPAGLLSAHVTATPAWPKTSPVPAVALPAMASSSASVFAMPWSVVGLIVLIAAAVYGAMRFLRWRRREQEAEVAAAAERARRETERRLVGTRAAAAVGARAAAPDAPPPAAAPGSPAAPGTAPDAAAPDEAHPDSGSADSGAPDSESGAE